MAGDWIPIQTDLSRRREVISISKQTGRSRYEVVGLLIEFWGWASGETDVDAIVDVYVDTLPSLVGGDYKLWEAIMHVGWLEETSTGIRIPNFDRWMSQGAKTRLRKNLRQKKWRDEQSKSSKNVDASVDTQPSTTEQNRTEQKNKSKTPLPPVAKLPSELDTVAFGNAWCEWEQHRREIKKKLTPLAAKRQINLLLKMGHGRAIAAIQHSITQGYTGIFEAGSRGSGKNKREMFSGIKDFLEEHKDDPE